MSSDQLRAFWETVKQDAGLQDRLRLITTEDPQVAVTQVVEIAGQAGFRFSAEDYQAGLPQPGTEPRSLSAEDLDQGPAGLPNRQVHRSDSHCCGCAMDMDC